MTTEEFLFALFGDVPEGALEIRASAPKGVSLSPANLILWKPLPLAPFRYAGSRVEHLNQEGYGIGFGCCVRHHVKEAEQRVDPKTKKPYTMRHPRGNEKDAIYVVALWIDIDAKDGGTRDDIAQIAQPPTITVASGGGYHAYWLLSAPLPITDENRRDVKRTLKGMAKKTGCDLSSAELARNLRLPGTINTKPERNGARCEVIDADLTRRYAYDEMAKYGYYAGPREAEYKITRALPKEASESLPDWVQQYLASGALDGERNRMLFRAACSYAAHGLDYDRAERDLGSRAAQDGLSSSEIYATLRSAYQREVAPSIPQHHRMRMSNADRKLKGTTQ